jgi:hypothetical protein
MRLRWTVYYDTDLTAIVRYRTIIPVPPAATLGDWATPGETPAGHFVFRYPSTADMVARSRPSYLLQTVLTSVVVCG